jgi:excisionase family DNA binding protein
MSFATVTDVTTLPLLLTMKDITKITGLSREVVYRLPHLQGFPAVRFGRSIRVPREAFLRWLDQQAGVGEGR